MATTVYTDGACTPNPGPGGWAWAIPGGAHASGFDPATTNQRMELAAALHAVQSNPGPVRVISDSTYVVNCFRDRWYEGWERRGWKNSKGQPVENQDLWRPLVVAYLQRAGQIRFEWVKGHSDDVMNDLVDRLASEAARTQKARSGPEPPTDLGEPDLPGPMRPQSGDLRVSSISGWRLVVLGLRPPTLGGYDPTNPVATEVRRKLTEIIIGLRSVHPDIQVITGLGLGAEQLAAEAAAAADVPYTAVLAYPDPERVWPAPTQQRYRQLLAGAAADVTLSNRQPKSKQEAGITAAKRDRALLAAAHGAVVIWDGKDRHIGEYAAELERHIPGDVWIIRPNE
jgi:ribonuclease HI